MLRCLVVVLSCVALLSGAGRGDGKPRLVTRRPVTDVTAGVVAFGNRIEKRPTVFESGEPIEFNYPAVSQPTLFTGAQVPEIVVPAGTGRLEISVVTDTPGADVDLYVRFGTPPEISNGTVVADYVKEGFSGFEALTITLSSSPSLQQGSYFVALVLRTLDKPVSGVITATHSAEDYPGLTLVPGAPSSFWLPSVTQPTLFVGDFLYRIIVPEGAVRLVISADAMRPGSTADIDLLVRRGSPPNLTATGPQTDYASESQGGSESIVITPQSDPPLSAGALYVALALYTTGSVVEGLVRTTLDVTGPPPGQNPALTITPNSLSFHAQAGANPANQSISVRNSGGGTLTYTARADVPWVSITPAGGTSTGETDTLTVAVDTSGLRAGTHSGSVTVAAGAAGSRTVSISLELTGGGPPSGSAPVVSSGGVVNAANYGTEFAPGMIFTVFGQQLAPSTAMASEIPLPTTLEGVSVEVIDQGVVKKAPLFFVSAGQINAQLPFDLNRGQVQVRVRSAAGTSNAETVTVRETAPRLFTVSQDGKGEAVVLHNADWQVVSAEHPAQPGEVLNMFLTGLGPVSPAVPAGAAGGDNGQFGPLDQTMANVSMKVDEIPVSQIYFSGLAPGFVGLYQLSFQVPENVGNGPVVIEVEAGGQSSQTDVFLVCGRGWKQLSNTVIGAAGGTASANGFEMAVPAGAMAGNQNIEILGLTTPAPSDPNQVTEVYGLGGLPETTAAPITVTLDPKPGVSFSGKTYVVVAETGGGQFLVPATVQGGKIRATIPPRQGRPTEFLKAENASPFRRRSMAVEEAGLMPRQESFSERAEAFVYGVSGYREHGTGHFTLHYPVSLAADDPATPIGATLEAAYSALTDMAVNVGRVEVWPVDVWFADFQKSNYYTWQHGYEPWGEIRRAFWIGRDMIRLNTAKMETGPEIQVMRWKAAHMLLHVVARAYIGSGVSSLDTTTWRWLDEALATWFERRMAGGRYIPWQVKGMETFLVSRGLEFQYKGAIDMISWKSNWPAMTFHGYGASLFIEHLAEADDGTWLSRLLGRRAGITGGSRQPLPVEALRDVYPDLGNQWFEFSKKYVAGTLFDGVRLPTEERVIALAEENEGGFDKADDKKVTFQWNAPDLSARFYAIRVAHKYPEGKKLEIQVRGEGARAIVHRVNMYDEIQGLEGTITAGQKLEIDDIRKMPNKLEWLLIMVVSTHAEKPFTATQPITLTAKIASEKGPIVQRIEEAADANVLEFGVFANVYKTSCKAPDGKSYSPCPLSFDIWSSQHVGDGNFVYSKTWVSGSGTIKAYYFDHTAPPYCNTSLIIDMEVELSEDGEMVNYAKATRVCGFSGTDWKGNPYTTSERRSVELRNVPLDENFSCTANGECVHYSGWGDVTDKVVKIEWRTFYNGLLQGELTEYQFKEGSQTSSIGVHFKLQR